MRRSGCSRWTDLGVQHGPKPALAAAYAVYIVQGHVFFDGNKRTGAAAMLAFLEANGVRVRLSADEIATMMIDLQQRAEAGADAGALVGWIAASITPRRRA